MCDSEHMTSIFGSILLWWACFRATISEPQSAAHTDSLSVLQADDVSSVLMMFLLCSRLIMSLLCSRLMMSLLCCRLMVENRWASLHSGCASGTGSEDCSCGSNAVVVAVTFA